MELTPDQRAAAEACGCVFRIDGRPFVATRDGGGVFETQGTLSVLIEGHGRGGEPGKQETVQEAAAADGVSEQEIAGERGAGGAQEVRRHRAGARPNTRRG